MFNQLPGIVLMMAGKHYTLDLGGNTLSLPEMARLDVLVGTVRIQNGTITSRRVINIAAGSIANPADWTDSRTVTVTGVPRTGIAGTTATTAAMLMFAAISVILWAYVLRVKKTSSRH